LCAKKLKIYYKAKSKKRKKLQPEAKLAFEPKAKNYNSNKQVEWVEKVAHWKDTDPVNEVEAPTRFPCHCIFCFPIFLTFELVQW
jgi:hypothetical protein